MNINYYDCYESETEYGDFECFGPLIQDQTCFAGMLLSSTDERREEEEDENHDNQDDREGSPMELTHITNDVNLVLNESYGQMENADHQTEIQPVLEVHSSTTSTTLDKSPHLNEEHTFGHYQLENIVGEGAFGKVCRATHGPTGQKVAVKLLLKEHYQDRDSCMDLRREVDLLMGLNHVNVLGCHEAIHGEDHIGIVTPLCYKDLFQFWDESFDDDLSWSITQQMSLDIFSGLNYLHQNNIIHLDIKPENILVRRKAAPNELDSTDFLICDLGMCQQGNEGGEAIIPTGPCGKTRLYRT